MDQRRHRRLGIVERGLGLWWEVILIDFELSWALTKLRLASSNEQPQSFLGRLDGKSRSVAIWVRDEEAGRQSF